MSLDMDIINAAMVRQRSDSDASLPNPCAPANRSDATRGSR